MVEDYQEEIESIEALNKIVTVKNILLHASLSPNLSDLTLHTTAFSFGLVLNPEDEVKTIVQKYNLANIPFIQIMTVKPGFQGSSFQISLLNKIEQLRSLNYRNKIFLDGGINEETITLILAQKYLPDVLCIGSYFTQSNDIKKRKEKLIQLIKSS